MLENLASYQVAAARDLTVVMYHYVRPLQSSRYPAIKGRSLVEFRNQLRYLLRHYQPVGIEQVIAAIETGEALPEKAVLLTFDDGYADHYLHVFPLLHEAGVQGAFFPPVAPVRDHQLLDVNRIHFVLAAAPDIDMLRAKLDRRLADCREEFSLAPVETYWEKYGHASRFDSASTIYVKRMLQVGLPLALRNRLAGELFAEYVSSDEAAFAQELYMDCAQLALMQRSGMYIGSHGSSHSFMDAIDPAQQASEVDASLDFLRAIGSPVDRYWAMCYPYGSWNQSLLEILRRRKCSIGFTVEVGVARLSHDDRLLLPRIDTNDLPTEVQ